MAEQCKHRILFHVDMNCFYASVELAHHPEWIGRPLAIAGRPEERHGIIVTSSYEARRRGVRTTMTIGEARSFCPDLIVKHPDFDLYRETSKQLFRLLQLFADRVEKASIDEGYMDVSKAALRRNPKELAEGIQRKILHEMKLPCSIGIASNKFLAKMASNMEKPMGLTIIREEELAEKIWTLAIGRMHGVGPKTEKRLVQLRIQTIGQFAALKSGFVRQLLGKNGLKLWNYANGRDDREVDPLAWDRYKSIGHSQTLAEDTCSAEIIRKTFEKMADKLTERLKREHAGGYELTLTIRYGDWTKVNRNLSLSQPLIRKEEILKQSLLLFRSSWSGKPVRLLGISLSHFIPLSQASKQLDLFSYSEDAKDEKLLQLFEQINSRFGAGALCPAAALIKGKKNN